MVINRRDHTHSGHVLDARKELGGIWQRLMGAHYPAMSLVFVQALLDEPGKIELEATAVIPPPAVAPGEAGA